MIRLETLFHSFYITDRSKATLQLWFHLFYAFEFLYCLNLMYVFIFLFKVL